MSTDPRPFDAEALRRWCDATTLPLALPPGPAEGWTSLVEALGPRRLLGRTDAGHEVCDRLLLRALHEALGRVLRGDEADALLWVAPVPADQVEDALCELLAHPSYWVRQHAAWLVAWGGRPDAVAWLEPLLGDPDNDVRRAAVRGLGSLGGARAVHALLAAGWDADEAVDGARVEVLCGHWEAVAGALDQVPDGGGKPLLEAGLAAREGRLDALLAALSDPSEPLRHAAGVAVASLPAVAEQLAEHVVAILRSAPGVDSQRGAIRALGAAGDVGVELSIELLEAEEWTLRQAGAVALGLAGARAAEAAPVLYRCLDDADPDVQREAALALLACGQHEAVARQRLLRTVSRSADFLDRARRLGVELGALDALIGRRVPDADLLAVALAPGDERMRGVALVLLATVRPDVLGPLLGAMAADEPRRVPLAVRRGAAAALLRMGFVPATAPCRLRLLLEEVDDDGALPAVGLGVPHLAELAMVASHDGDGPIRAAAWRSLRSAGTDALPYRAMARWQAVHDPDPTVRRVAASWVGAAWEGEGAGAHLQRVLVPVADGEAARTRSLRAIWRDDPSLGSAVARALQQHDEHRVLARTAARLRGRHVEPGDAPSLCRQALIELDDARWMVREAAADLLGALDPSALSEGLLDEVVEALEARARSDYDADVQQAAQRAARALGGKP